MKKTAVDCGWG